MASSRIVAVLGPTNTGKTHFAVERMLAHRSGMIGFPLRLLAREIYDKIVAIRGKGAVALLTGEEKIAPESARWVVATVEAMPVDREVAFLAVDEIQLAADRERGHVFTDRLLRARGTEETMFLGSDTVRPLLKRLVPGAEIITRPRFSLLTYAGEHKLQRLPRRSAIVAFTARDVYALAEVVRRQRGGAAVVLGALSPRTRNAQVAMYQAGEVDYLVATDAIGMGLNMDLQHVGFASLVKFDGQARRRLTATEIAQIAGRAGRHMNDGTFGTTDGIGALAEAEVEAVEGHFFPPLKALRWRNAELDFGSLGALQRSLDRAPFDPALIKVRDALDDRSLALLARRDHIRDRASGPAGVRLLWQVCQIPDFRKTLTEAHLQLLDAVFGHLASPGGVLPDDWVARMVTRLERTDGDIDTLVGRLAHIRTWTYVSQRTEWLRDARHWQERTREIEDRLSDALHERLAQRFVDRRTSALLRSLRERGQMPAEVLDGGEVVVDGHDVGRLEGLAFRPATAKADAERRVLAAAARRVVGSALAKRAAELIDDPDERLRVDEQGLVTWREGAVARLLPGSGPLAPRLELLAGEELPARGRESVRRRLEGWLEARLAADAKPLIGLVRLREADGVEGPARGLAYRLVEGLGNVETEAVAELVRDLAPRDRRALTRHGVRFGVHHVYLPGMLKGRSLRLRGLLWRIAKGGSPLASPPAGRTSLPRDAAVPDEHYAALGFAPFSSSAVRVDILERVSARLRALAREDGGFRLAQDLGALTGLGEEALAQLVRDLGYRSAEAEEGVLLFVRRPPKGRARRAPARPDSPFAALARLRQGS